MFDDYSVVSDLYSVEHCKGRIREMVRSLNTKIGSIRAAGRYHQEGTRSLENDYSVKKQVLGVGINGSVRLALGRKSRRDQKFAVKSFDLKSITRKKAEAQLISELEIYMTVDHPHIVQLVDVYEASSQVHMVMQCMDGGELTHRLADAKSFNNAEAVETIRQILVVLKYLHESDIVHRDLKPENFLYDKAGSSHLLLCDFGFSAQWKEGDANMSTPCGSLCYIAPEVLNKSYTKQCDMWSVGVIAFALLSGYLPFWGERAEMISSIKACEYKMHEDRWGGVSANARAFVLALMDPDQQQRLTASAALQHPWILETRCERPVPDIHTFVTRGLRNFGQASKLQRVCSSIASLTPCGSAARDELRAIFMKMDTSGLGAVKLPEFRQALLGESSTADDGQLIDSVFSMIDEDGDGCVKYSDFLATLELAADQPDRGRVAEVFRRFDVKNAGYIVKENVCELLSSVSQKDGDSVEQILEDLRLDYKKRMSYEAFEARLFNRPEALPAENASGHGGKLVKQQPELGELLRVHCSQIFKRQPQMGQVLSVWLKKAVSHLGTCAIGIDTQYAADNLDWTDHQLMWA